MWIEVAHDALGDQDRVLEVVAVPRHERDEGVAAQRQFAEVRRRSVGDHVAELDLVAHTHQRTLVDAGRGVRPLELLQPVDVDARLGRVGLFGRTHDDPGAVDLFDDTGPAGDHHGAGVAGHHVFHARAHQGRVGLDQRHGLLLHVRAHQGPVGVVVFQERDQRSGHRDDLLGRHVHQVDGVLRQQRRLAIDPAGDQVVDDLTVVQLDVGLGDDVLRLFHGRHVDHLFGDLAVLDPPVRALDETVLVDHRVGGQRVDQADVRAFRRLDRADPAVVGRVHVAHFEAGALAGQTARAKRRQATLVGDLRQRVGLVHELRELRGAEELPHRRGRRLGVDQVMRHDRVDIDAAHPLLDRPLHAQQADPVLVLQQLADRTHPAVAQVVDVVDLALAVPKADQGLEHRQHVVLADHPHVVRAVELQAHVHLHAADRGQVVALRVEEQRLEHRLGGVDRRRLARAHHPVDVEQRVLAGGVLVHSQGVADVGADRHLVDVEDVEAGEALLFERGQHGRVEFVAGFGVDLAGLHVDQVAGQVLAGQRLGRQQQGLEAGVGEALGVPRRDLLAGGRDLFAGVGVDQRIVRLGPAPAVGAIRRGPAAAGALLGLALHVGDVVVEGGEDLLPVHAQRHQECGGRQLTATVDTDVDDVLGVELEVEPRAAVGDHPGGEQELARGVGLALVVVEEDARRAVHLRDDDALGPVDDEGALLRHERDVAHVDVLLLDVLHRAGAGLFVGLEHDQPQLHLQRRGVGHVPLDAFLDVVLRLLELVGDVLEHRPLVEVLDREDGLEHRLDALVAPVARTDLALQELFVGGALNLDEVRHLHSFGDATERLPDPLLAGEGLRHLYPLWDARNPDGFGVGSVILRPPSNPLAGARTLECPCIVRGAPSHGRRAVGHASELHARRIAARRIGISRSPPDRPFRTAREAPSRKKMERRRRSGAPLHLRARANPGLCHASSSRCAGTTSRKVWWFRSKGGGRGPF